MNLGNTYSAIDITKFILSFFVIAIHTELTNTNIFLFKLCGFAVPLFFIFSGFFLHKNINKNGYLKRYISKLFKLYLIWVLIYLPLTIVGIKICYNGISNPIKSFLIGVFIMGENYMSWPLWFLLALIVGTILISGYLKIANTRIILLAIVGTFFLWLGNYLNELKNVHEGSFYLILLKDWYFKIFLTTRNGLFQAFPMMSFGVLLSRYHKVWNPKKYFSFFLLLGTIVSIAYIYDYPYSINILSCLIAFFLLKLNIPQYSWSYILRNLSTLIYFSHMYFVFFTMTILQLNIVLSFFLSSLLALIVSFGIIKGMSRYHFLVKLVSG